MNGGHQFTAGGEDKAEVFNHSCECVFGEQIRIKGLLCFY